MSPFLYLFSLSQRRGPCVRRMAMSPALIVTEMMVMIVVAGVVEPVVMEMMVVIVVDRW